MKVNVRKLEAKMAKRFHERSLKKKENDDLEAKMTVGLKNEENERKKFMRNWPV